MADIYPDQHNLIRGLVIISPKIPATEQVSITPTTGQIFPRGLNNAIRIIITENKGSLKIKTA